MKTTKFILFFIIFIFLYSFTSAVYSQPGTLVTKIKVPVLSPTGIGVSLAVDCNGNLYYTNFHSAFLYKMDKNGNLLSTNPLHDSTTGLSVTIGEMSWDQSRQMLWGGGDLNDLLPQKVYLINPNSGAAIFKFTVVNATYGLIDGLTYDNSDSSIYISDDMSKNIDHYSSVTGLPLPGSPFNAHWLAGGDIDTISGIISGKGNILYLGKDGQGKIIKVDKTTGLFLSNFTTVKGRDEGLECDVVNFAPLEVMWSKDAYNDSVYAMQIETGTCQCAGSIGIHKTDKEIPVQFDLNQNYPNPFNPSTSIKFSVPKLSFVSLKIYDESGKEMETLLNENLTPGNYYVTWDGSDYSSGAYFYTLKADDYVVTKKMILIK